MTIRNPLFVVSHFFSSKRESTPVCKCNVLPTFLTINNFAFWRFLKPSDRQNESRKMKMQYSYVKSRNVLKRPYHSPFVTLCRPLLFLYLISYVTIYPFSKYNFGSQSALITHCLYFL